MRPFLTRKLAYSDMLLIPTHRTLKLCNNSNLHPTPKEHVVITQSLLINMWKKKTAYHTARYYKGRYMHRTHPIA